ncbi:MAG: hypothetical protein EXR91_04910 [Gemmatimonadetes bacterium]|nr:hypothetical protein [Gemmatimonadota bacterium]
MPGLTPHFALANRVLDRWRRSGENAPFGLYASADLNAFLQGAVGPDFGYMPGGHRPLSELAHGVRTGELTSRLIRSARTSVERAFAWGWLTHVLGDRLIHPWIGRGVGELTVGCSRTFVAGATDPGSHLRVEIGVDCCFAARDAAARGVRLRPAFDALSINFLSHAYAKTYGFVPRHDSLLASHRHMGRRVSQSLGSIGLLSALMDRGTGPRRWSALQWALRAAHRSTLISGISMAYLSPVRPGRWLMDAIDAVIPSHTDLFMTMYRQGGTDIGDYNLDTGAPLTRTPSDARHGRLAEVGSA